MHPLVIQDLAKYKMADLDAEAARDRRAAQARQAADRPDDHASPHRWMLRRLFSRLLVGGSGA